MSVVSVRARSFILALFIRDDGERFLLGDRGFDFKDSQLHFSANTIENDEVAKQGVDGVMLAGQVRRASVQSFDGYVGDGTTLKEEVEQMRRDFIAFFAKGHHFRVIYIDCNRNAWQRKGGYLVDAPEVKELWQIHPEYHVGLNFEDVNYYEYDENAEGEEILSNIISVPISSDVEGGLVWDENGAVSEPEEIEYDTETATASGTNISIADAVEAPFNTLDLKGNTSQQTYTGKNLIPFDIPSANTRGLTVTADINSGAITFGGTTNAGYPWVVQATGLSLPAGTYTFSIDKALSYTLSLRLYETSSSYPKTAAIQAGQTSATVTTTYTITQVVGLYGASTSGIVVSDTTIHPQFELNSSATSFEPYVGGVPAPNPDYPQVVQTVTGENVVKISDGQGNEQSYEVNLGKNLFDNQYYKTHKSDFVNAYQGYYFAIELGNEFKNQITASMALNGTAQTGLVFALTDSIGSAPSVKSRVMATDGSITTRSYDFRNSSHVYLQIGATTQQTALNTGIDALMDNYNIQVELGSQATSYAAYFTPIELCKIGDYQDHIYKSGDKWYVHKEVGKAELGNGSNWRRLNTGTTGEYRFSVKVSNTDIPTSSSSSTFVDMYSDHWQARTRLQTYQQTQGIATTTSTDFGVESFIAFVESIKTSDVDGWKAWLTANMPVVYYPSTTPTDTEITNAALVAQLEAILDGGTSAGTNNITTVIAAGNAQGELEITYYTKYDAKVVGGGYVWEAGGSGGPTIVTNESISAVSPVWTVFGPALNPMLENTTTGEQIQYVGMISEGQTLVVDMGEQTARLDGLNVISNIVGEYLTLAPGSNTLLFSADSDAPASEIGWSEIVG